MSTTDSKAFFKIGYGLYVLTCHDGKKDNGLIVNTVMQLTSNPTQIAVAINKDNYSHGVVLETKKMTVNCLTEKTPFSVFERFGFQSGKNVDKFAGEAPLRAENGLAILPEYSNAFFSLSVKEYTDLGTHGLFICTVDEARVLSDEPSITYAYYHANTKPKPAPTKKTGYVCKICGYVYEGEPLPPDFVCPWCKHGAEDFEKLQ